MKRLKAAQWYVCAMKVRDRQRKKPVVGKKRKRRTKNNAMEELNQTFKAMFSICAS
ncbi:hypothetical protein DsansV1_C12g0115791 [Dioscorea sansibarensis]